VLAVHPAARLVGIDESPRMLEEARLEGAELLIRRLQDELPEGPFDLVFSVLAVHHLDAAEKAGLFHRVRAALRPGGRFVLGDVVVPESPEDAVTPLTPGFEQPDPLPVLRSSPEEAGFAAHVAWSWKDLAVLAGDA
jgi:tRNA (cmo5U34)-methyltransferase